VSPWLHPRSTLAPPSRDCRHTDELGYVSWIINPCLFHMSVTHKVADRRHLSHSKPRTQSVTDQIEKGVYYQRNMTKFIFLLSVTARASDDTQTCKKPGLIWMHLGGSKTHCTLLKHMLTKISACGASPLNGACVCVSAGLRVEQVEG
jgi:hypothetical protein